MSKSKKLFIVESPTKAKTISQYLGKDFVVKSSVGHVRDLPPTSRALKIEEVGEGKWHFIPEYAISEGKQKVVRELKAAVKDASEVYLASDPDREGEAIAWHLQTLLEPAGSGKAFRRVSYNEVTKDAVEAALKEPREVDMRRVNAQQARRILDRIVGYKVSPLLWTTIPVPNPKTLSAGRVQTVALRLLVERQREIDAFTPETYYLFGVEARKGEDKASTFKAQLARLDGAKPSIQKKQAADNLLLDLAGAQLEVKDIKNQPKVRHALPPFTTSTLQQAASSVLGFSPGKTMATAQQLFETGLITYMRTDAVFVSASAAAAAKDFIVANYGDTFYPATPNVYKSKEDSQGAHEAIRPTDVMKEPGKMKLGVAELKLYDLIWRRFVASQMAEAKTTVQTVSLAASKPALAHSYLFTASATTIEFEGFLHVMKMSLKKKRADGEDDDETDEVAVLPKLSVGEELQAVRWLADEKQTKGPTYYSEASLIRALEENGVGRPSTYAQTIETLKARHYAVTEKRKLVPTKDRGVLVWDWLEKKLEPLFNVGYTAKMEKELDQVEEKGEPMDEMLSNFYAGFVKSLAACREPPPDRAKFGVVFTLLDQVTSWRPAQKVGTKTYDDHAFVEKLKKKVANPEKTPSAKELESIIRLVLIYIDQIPDAEKTLKENGLVGSTITHSEKADPELVKYCFEVMDRIDGLIRNPFLKSLRDQVDHGHGLSPKQLTVLARAIAERCDELSDGAQVLERLSQFAPAGGFEKQKPDPIVPYLFDLLTEVKEWREPLKRGRRTYNDESFVESLHEQYRRRRLLSPRQVGALKRVVFAYKAQIADFDKRAKEIGLTEPSANEGEIGGSNGAANKS